MRVTTYDHATGAFAVTEVDVHGCAPLADVLPPVDVTRYSLEMQMWWRGNREAIRRGDPPDPVASEAAS